MRTARCLITIFAPALLLTLVLFAAPSFAQTAAPRPFRLGFTPFPYEISYEAVDFTYAAIAEDADLIVHHFDDGVPWPEALAGDPWPAGMQTEWEDRLRRTDPDLAIMLSMTPINFLRSRLAPYRGDKADQPLPPEWEGRPFDDPDVMTAYANYVLRGVEFFKPDYLVIGIEVNILLDESPDLWPGYLTLQEATYQAVKAAHPDLPVFVSVLGMAYIDNITDHDAAAQRAALPDILKSSDYFALSLYPYMTAYMTTPLPAEAWNSLFALSDKPLAVTETGYLAQTLNIAGLTFESTPEKQAEYIGWLLNEAQARHAKLVINFVLRDYDALWEQIGGGDLASVWRDTGLYDEAGNARPALELWRAALARPYSGDPP